MNETDDPEEGIPPSKPSDEKNELTESSQAFGTEVSQGHRKRRSTFFKYSTHQSGTFDSFKVEKGGQWTEKEADERIREFLVRLAGDRELGHESNPVELARKNDLLLLFGPEEEKLFAKLAVRFPSETLRVWTDLLGGGDSSESFGPRSRAERQDEKAIALSIKKAFRRRTITCLVVIGLVVFAIFFFKRLANEGIVDDTNQALRFASQESEVASEGEKENFGAPIVELELVSTIDLLVALQEGEGPAEDRVRQIVPETLLEVQPGEIIATVFGYNGGGQVALMGPEGWLTEACIRASVTDGRFRPFDVVVFELTEGMCSEEITGRKVSPTCLGEQTLIIPLYIPQGEVAHSEGGSGWAEMIRIGYEMDSPGWETLAIRGTIAVDAREGQTEIPLFSGEVGDELVIDFNDSNSGNCILM
ncbi:MAG TPA: hypothetical protein QF762_07835 [Acidimicrobiales bacterium]|nr:hypothetical protein [Acidimicrobiales bacterium]